MLFNKLKSVVALATVLAAFVAGGVGLARAMHPPEKHVAAPESSVAADPARFRASLGGATVEVIAVSTIPSGPKTWWGPDGSPLEEAPVDSVAAEVRNGDDEVRVILARVEEAPRAATLKWLPSHDGSYKRSRPTRSGEKVPGMEYYVASFHRDRASCEVEVRVAAGRWKTEATDPGAGGHSFLEGPIKFYFGKAREYRGGTAISVGQNIVGQDSRVVAVDAAGQEHAPSWQSGAGGDILSLLDAEFRLPPAQIREYRVQSRPFQRVELGPIALRPRSRQDPDEPAQQRASSDSEPRSDADTDGDGLSDFQELHKYRSDPNKFSTAGDGVSDGQWQRRREFTYTVRTVVRVMPPVNETCLSDDYQDARVLSKGANYVELEVIHYPLNTNAAAIHGNPAWRTDAAGKEAVLSSGPASRTPLGRRHAP